MVFLDLGRVIVLSPDLRFDGDLIMWNNAIMRRKFEHICQRQRPRDDIRTMYYTVKYLYEWLRSMRSPSVAYRSLEAVLRRSALARS